jgi:hypothetical protein
VNTLLNVVLFGWLVRRDGVLGASWATFAGALLFTLAYSALLASELRKLSVSRG